MHGCGLARLQQPRTQQQLNVKLPDRKSPMALRLEEQEC